MCLADVAAALGVTAREVRRSFTEPMRPDGKRRTRPAAERDAEIVSRYGSLETVKEIASALQMSTTALTAVLERCGVERRSRGFRRTRPGKPPGPLRRIESDVVVSLDQQGLTQRQVAAELDCSASSSGSASARPASGPFSRTRPTTPRSPGVRPRAIAVRDRRRGWDEQKWGAEGLASPGPRSGWEDIAQEPAARMWMAAVHHFVRSVGHGCNGCLDQVVTY
jgi:hypothetical protein